MQPDGHDLKIELIEAKGSDMNWLELKPSPKAPNDFLDMQRESGDGDSGAECKESPGTDFLEIKDVLTTITREVQGAEKTKDNRKLSKIPVRQSRQMKETKPKENLEDNIKRDLKDIYQDLSTVPQNLIEDSTESSLSPQAPLAVAEDDFSVEEDTILEAPEEFRGVNCEEIETVECSDDSETEKGELKCDSLAPVAVVAAAIFAEVVSENRDPVTMNERQGERSGSVPRVRAVDRPPESIADGDAGDAGDATPLSSHVSAASEVDNNRPVFQHASESNSENNDSDTCGENAVLQPLRSRDINKRFSEAGSRLKLLENKLKQAAGLVSENTSQCDQIEAVILDRNKNECKVEDVEHVEPDGDDAQPQIEITELDSPADLNAFLDNRFGGSCEFDIKQIGSFSGFGLNSDFYVVYDELEENYSSSNEDELPMKVDNTSGTMHGEGEAARKRHNPDHDNLKSLLKKPGRNKDKKNRVSFNENRNEFFDADYIILIREECDYDEDDDDGVCTCNQHEMVRLTCCEPGCTCGYDEGSNGGPTPQSPKFAPPLEFVDSVTLSPPEGYKDMDLGEQQLLALQQMARHRQQLPVCRECSGVHESDSNSGSDVEEPQYIEKPQERISGEKYQQSQTSGDQQTHEEKEKIDQSQQTTPTTPPADCTSVQSRYIMETITMTTVTERRLVREVDENSPVETSTSPTPTVGGGSGSPISGILKGGKLWNKQATDNPVMSIKVNDNTQPPDISTNITSDEEGNTLSRRSVRFHESESETRDSCDGEADKGISSEETDKKPEEIISQEDEDNQNQKETETCNNSVSPEATEMMLTFKLGHHVLISNNSLRPNSAVRQLFPCSKPLVGKTDEDGSVHQYLVTAESLKAFEEAKRAKLPNIMTAEGEDSIRKTIERNTLRRSLIRYEPRSKKQPQKTDNSLVERIKQLTCDVDDPPVEEEIPPRGSPPGEESTKSTDSINQLNNRNQDKSFSPSSSSTTSSNSSMSSTYKKITDLFGKREKASDAQNNAINESNNKQSLLQTAPDLGNGSTEFIEPQQCNISKINATSEARKQFLSTLAPLTACVGNTTAVDEYQYQYQLANNPGERVSVASTVGTEYSLEDIDEALKNDDESKKVAPDVLVGTPSASESTDELAMFVQQDASRIERIKKRYQPETTAEEDDEHDDYGFNRRPSVRGIKPRFGSTTEILQQIQSQLQPPNNSQPTTQRPANQMWPYYSETGLDNPKSRTCPQGYNHQYPFPSEEIKSRTIGHQYRPTSLIEENIYQNCPNQRCSQLHYGPNVNHFHPPVMRIGGGCSDFYQTLPARPRSGRPESPPPMELSKSYHQTMVLIPYNRIENFHSGNVSPNPIYSSPEQCNYARFTNKKVLPNTINKRYSEPVYHGTLPGRLEDSQYQLKLGQKQMIRLPYSSGQPVQVHLMTARSESPLPGQFATARATQTPSATLSTCNYYNPGPPNTRYRPVLPHNGIWHGDNPYGNKINRHSFPNGGHRYPIPDNISLADSDSQLSNQLPNGYRSSTIDPSVLAPSSPTKNRFTSERGVPEGAASVSPQDSTATVLNSSTMTSPTSPPNPANQNPNGKSLYYAMNV